MNRSKLTAILFGVALLPLLSLTKSDYHRPRWSDVDGDCQNTRTEVLVSQCGYVHFKDARQCSVDRATCRDTYSGLEVASDSAPQSFQVDHLYPASEAWKRKRWTKAEFSRFFNDPRNLVLTTARTNERKGDRMPQEWCPTLGGARIFAAKRISAVVDAYQFPLTREEAAGVAAWSRGECAPEARVL